MADGSLVSEVARLLGDTLSHHKSVASSATYGITKLSRLPEFPVTLLIIANSKSVDGNNGQSLAAATYLKNYIKDHVDELSPQHYMEFRNRLVQTMLQAEPPILKILAEALRFIVIKDFVKSDSWPELVPELSSVIGNSNLFVTGGHSQFKSVNALTIFQTIVKQFQYFLNPKIPKEPVPDQLEQIARDILVSLQPKFHILLNKVLDDESRDTIEIQQVLIIICKCFYFSVRSYMPSALTPVLPSFCTDLYRLMGSLNLDEMTANEGNLLRLTICKRGLILFNSLVTRHRKHADKLMPNIVKYASNIVKQSSNVSKMDFLSERIVSLAFDVISHVLETGPGWRIVSPQFSKLLESAIFPALVLNEKDLSTWEEDQEEYMRRNLPSELEDISGWNEELFTARKSAINLLGVIALAKGTSPSMQGNGSNAKNKRKKGEKNRKNRQCSIGELLVMPFLSKFSIPADTKSSSKLYHEYYGVLIAYGGLQDFLKERNMDYISTIVRSRILCLYLLDHCPPQLIAAANWVIGTLAACLPQEMSSDIYSSLIKSLAMMNHKDCSLYPVRASAAGAIAELLENEYFPPEWMPLLDILHKRIDIDDENEATLFLQLLSTLFEVGQEHVSAYIPMVASAVVNVLTKNLPCNFEPWSQTVERGFSTLAVMAKMWEENIPAESEEKYSNELLSDWAATARSFSGLLQQAWFISRQPMEDEEVSRDPFSASVGDASALLGFVIRFIIQTNADPDLKIVDLLSVWANVIAEWGAWEEMEDLDIFTSIKDAIGLHTKYDMLCYFTQSVCSQVRATGTQTSIIEGISTFIRQAISAYPSAARRACSSAVLLLHTPKFSSETENIKQSLAVKFSGAAHSRFTAIGDIDDGLSKPLLLVICSCYLSYPKIAEIVLESSQEGGFIEWASALAYICSSSYEHRPSSTSELKLAVLTLGKIVEQLLGVLPTSDRRMEVLRSCFASLLQSCIHLKTAEDAEDGNDSDEASEEDQNEDDDDDDDDDDDEDSEEDELEETEEEFLNRYAEAAAALESGDAVEEDDDEETDEWELDALDEIDAQQAVYLLLEKHQRSPLVSSVPPELLTELLESYPEYSRFF